MVKKLSIEEKKLDITPDKLDIAPETLEVDRVKKPKSLANMFEKPLISDLEIARAKRKISEQDLNLAGQEYIVKDIEKNPSQIKEDKRNIVEKTLGLRQDQGVVFDTFELWDRPDNALRAGFDAFTKDQDIAKAMYEGFKGEKYVEHSDWLNIDKDKVGTRIAVDIAITVAIGAILNVFSAGVGGTAYAAGKIGSKIAKLAKVSKIVKGTSFIAKGFKDYSELTIKLTKNIFKVTKKGLFVANSPVMRTLLKYAPVQARKIQDLGKAINEFSTNLATKFKFDVDLVNNKEQTNKIIQDFQNRAVVVEEGIEHVVDIAMPSHGNLKQTEAIWSDLTNKGVNSPAYQEVKRLERAGQFSDARALTRKTVDAAQMRAGQFKQFQKANVLSLKEGKGHIVAYKTGFEGIKELLNSQLKTRNGLFRYGYTATLTDFKNSDFYKFLQNKIGSQNISLGKSKTGTVIIKLSAEGKGRLFKIKNQFESLMEQIVVKDGRGGFIDFVKPKNMSSDEFAKWKNQFDNEGLTKLFPRGVIRDKQLKRWDKVLENEKLSNRVSKNLKSFTPAEIEAQKTFWGANDQMLALNDEAVTLFNNHIKQIGLDPGVFKDSVGTYMKKTINPSIFETLSDKRVLRKAQGQSVIDVSDEIAQRSKNAPLSSDINKALQQDFYGEAPLASITDTLNTQIKALDFIDATDSIAGKLKLSKLIGGGHEEVVGSYLVAKNPTINKMLSIEQWKKFNKAGQYDLIELDKFKKALEANSKIAQSPLTKALMKDLEKADEFWVHKSVSNNIKHVFDLDGSKKIIGNIMDGVNNVFMKNWKGLTLLGGGIHLQNVMTNSIRMYTTLGFNLFNPSFWNSLRKNGSDLYSFKKLMTLASTSPDYHKKMLSLVNKETGQNLMKAQGKALKESLVKQFRQSKKAGNIWKSPQELMDYFDKFEDFGKQGLLGRTMLSNDAMQSTSQLIKEVKLGVGLKEYNKGFSLPKWTQNLIKKNFGLYGFVDEAFKITAYQSILDNPRIYDQLLSKTWNQGIINDKKIIGEAMRKKISSRSVKTALFDFSEISNFERTTLRKYVTFWTWGFKNAQLTITELINNPVRNKRLARWINSYREQTSNYGQEKNTLRTPSWLLKKGAVPIPWASDEQRDFYLNVQLPVQSGEDFIRSFGISSLHPFWKSVIQGATGIDLYTKSALDLSKDPTAGFAGTLTGPISRKWKSGKQLLNNIFDKDAKGALDTIFGGKIKSVDKEKREIYLEKLRRKKLEEQKRKQLEKWEQQGYKGAKWSDIYGR